MYIMRTCPISLDTDLKDIREASGTSLKKKISLTRIAALESIFPPSELKTFISSSKLEKEGNLDYWTKLVVGVRLFNKELGKGGENIQDGILFPFYKKRLRNKCKWRVRSSYKIPVLKSER